MTSAPAPIISGTIVGPYVVERQLASGGMSVLYVARDRSGARVVLKMVAPEIATRVRLQREARALSLVDHPGVVRVHGTGDHAGVPWIAMDLVDGTDLKTVIAERGPLPADAAIRYAIQASEALVAAHDAGVVHRDLKPSNVLLTPNDRIVLVDFGIAKRRGESRDGDLLTSAREVLGTPAYLSPEQLDHGLADERSDIWALGCLLYEMVVGAPPFGRGGSATTAAILRDEPTFPTHVPEDVAHIVTACLRKNSFARIASPRELLVLLRDASENPRTDSVAPVDRLSSATRPASRKPAARTGSPGASQRPSRPSVGATPSTPTRPSSDGRERSSSRAPAAQAKSSTMRLAAARGNMKGAAVRAVIAWFGETYGGDDVWARVLDRCSPELRSILRLGDPALGVIASGWYPTPLAGELIDVLGQLAAPADAHEFVARLGAAIARDNVTGVYRALFRLVASPTLLEANAQRVWQTYFDEGTLTITTPAAGCFEGRVRGWSRHHPSVCRAMGPLLEHALRSVGYAGLVVARPHCVAQGDSRCAFDGRWVM